jgi:hypothetical protein
MRTSSRIVAGESATFESPRGHRHGNAACLLALRHTSSYADSHARVPTTSASTPVRNVGWITGANFGLWFTGSSLS